MTPPAARDRSRQAVRASFIGTFLEFYDLAIYGTVAAIVFNQVFFPNVSPGLGTVQAIATFSAAYVVRPISGMLLGSLGDRIGRRKVLLGCFLIMGVSTLLIGLLPGYASIGWLAPVLLLVLRIGQGIGAGAEFSGAALLAVESAPAQRRGLFGTAPAAGATLGGVAATLVVLAMTAVTTEEQFVAWGWRVPFLFSAILVVYGLWLRARLPETPDFERTRRSGATSSRPLREVVRSHPTAVLAVLLIQFAAAGLGFFFQVFVVGYASTEVGLLRSDVLVGLLLGQFVGVAVTMASGTLSDRVNPRLIIGAGLGVAMAIAFPFFALVDSSVPLAFWIAMVLGQGIAVGLIFGPFQVFSIGLMPRHLRYAGTVTGRELGTMLGSAGVPLLAAQMAYLSGSGSGALSLLIVGVALVGLPGVFLARRARADPGPEADGARAERVTTEERS